MKKNSGKFCERTAGTQHYILEGEVCLQRIYCLWKDRDQNFAKQEGQISILCANNLQEYIHKFCNGGKYEWKEDETRKKLMRLPMHITKKNSSTSRMNKVESFNVSSRSLINDQQAEYTRPSHSKFSGMALTIMT